MNGILLTLQVTRRGRVVPLATTTSEDTIRRFCVDIFEDYVARQSNAADDVEAAVFVAELKRLRTIFSLVDPGEWKSEEDDLGK